MNNTVKVGGIEYSKSKLGLWYLRGHELPDQWGAEILDALLAAQTENAELDTAVTTLCEERDWYHDKLDKAEAENAKLGYTLELTEKERDEFKAALAEAEKLTKPDDDDEMMTPETSELFKRLLRDMTPEKERKIRAEIKADAARAEVDALRGDGMPDEIWADDENVWTTSKPTPYETTRYRKVRTAHVIDRTNLRDEYPGECSNCTAGVGLADRYCAACGREFEEESR